MIVLGDIFWCTTTFYGVEECYQQAFRIRANVRLCEAVLSSISLSCVSLNSTLDSHEHVVLLDEQYALDGHSSISMNDERFTL